MRRGNYNLEKEELLAAQMSQREKIRRQVYFSPSTNIEHVNEDKATQKNDDYLDESMNFSYISDWHVVF
jgi:hypothetical protein